MTTSSEQLLNTVLEAAIHLTQPRDTDALIESLLPTLSNAIFTSQHRLYLPVNSANLDEHSHTALEYRYVNGVIERTEMPISENAVLQACLIKDRTTLDDSFSVNEGDVCQAKPIHLDHKIHSVVVSTVEDSSKLNQAIIGRLLQLYENQLCILYFSERDTLTGLHNRRTFDGKLNALLDKQVVHANSYDARENPHERRHSNNTTLAWLAIVDIDHFKSVNDRFGHIYGDEVILHLAQLMRKCFRSADLLFRFGGEEFVVILEPIALDMAQTVLQRFRHTVENHAFPLVGKITVSIGFEGIGPTDFPATILDQADKALYFSKQHGRNCLHRYSELVSEGKLELPVADTASSDDSVDLF